MGKARTIPPEGPSPQALEAFARAIERGLHNAYPDFDFIVRRRGAADDSPSASLPAG